MDGDATLPRPAVKHKLISVMIIGAIVVVAGLLSFWTVNSPQMMQVQSEAQLRSSIFSASRTIRSYTISDGSGNYRFEFGFDYPDVPIPAGSPIQLRVYLALISENRSSPFLRGISLQLDNASLYADGMPRSGVRIVQQQEANIESYSFQIPDTNFLAPGSSHNITATMSFSLVDVNYVGFLKGPPMNIVLTGQLMVANTA